MYQRHLLALAVQSVVFLIFATHTFADVPARELERLIPRLLPACVRVESGGNYSSGVVICDDGLVLTVDHGLAGGDSPVTVVTSEGTRLPAIVLYRDKNIDFAILKVQQQDEVATRFSSVKLAPDKASLRRGHMLISVGYPAGTNGDVAVPRLGKAEAISSDRIRSTCLLTAGDSGGPVFDSVGQLVAINTQIGLGARTNLHLNVGAIRAMLVEKFDATIERTTFPQHVTGSNGLVSDAVEQRYRNRRISIRALKQPTDAPAVSGTLLNKVLAVTKLSLLPPGVEFSTRLRAGIENQAKLVHRDQRSDLAFLSLKQSTRLAPVSFTSDDRDDLAVGSLVVSGPDFEVAVVGGVKIEIPRRSPTLGCSVSILNGKVVTDRVQPNSASSDAGVQIGDQILQLRGSDIDSFEDIAAALEPMQPGDVVPFLMMRNGIENIGHGRLRPTANQILSRTEFLDGRAGLLSHRRSGFTDAIVHDADLSPQEMGSPLLDRNGRLVGINIARKSREAVLAVPITRVRAIAQQIKQ